MTVQTQYDLAEYPYYDPEEFGEDLLPQSSFHDLTIKYIGLILDWLFYGQRVGNVSAIEIHYEDEARPPISPDVALIDGFEFNEEVTSYYVGIDGPAPRVVFEVSSAKTWPRDLEHKPEAYAILGAKEYFAFDPKIRSLWTRQWKGKNRLIGWRLSPNGQAVEIPKDVQGRVWSEELQSWLMVERQYLRFYNADGNLRLTGEENANLLRIIAEQRLLEAEKREEAQRQAALEARQREAAERRRAEAAEQQIQAERLEKEQMRQRLREMGIDPDSLK